jgi:hypothetical protein
LQFLAGNITINKDENRKSSFMKVEALLWWSIVLIVNITQTLERTFRTSNKNSNKILFLIK